MDENTTMNLWVGVHACLATDNGIDIGGNEYDPASVKAAIIFVNNDLTGYADFEEPPYTVEVDAWIWSTWGIDPKELYPDYSGLREPSQEVLGSIVGWIFQPPMKDWD